jgi:hypothetical protein
MTNDIRDRLQDTARAVEATLPPGTGFIVLAFDMMGGRLEYISNGDRADCIKLMQEWIDFQKSNPQLWAKHSDKTPDDANGGER